MTPILLGSITARLGGLVIKNGGRLIFDPEAQLAKLVTNFVHLQSDGYMEIGSEECKFEGNAEIVLTGKFKQEIRKQ